MQYIKRMIQSLLILTLITGCSSYDFSRRPIQQGNLLNPASVARLKTGMSREDVSILMGTSLLSPMFSSNRWDYAYTTRKGSGSNDVRHLTLTFSNNQLVQIEHRP